MFFLDLPYLCAVDLSENGSRLSDPTYLYSAEKVRKAYFPTLLFGSVSRILLFGRCFSV